MPSQTKNESKKIDDLKKDMVDIHDAPSMTTDWGQTVSDPEHWLKAASNERIGGHLLEDQIARERVGWWS